MLTRRRILIGVLLLLLVAVGTFSYQAWTATRSLFDARGTAVQIQQQISTGDFDGATQSLADLRKDTHAARSATSGLLWDIGRQLPLVGANLDAMQTAAAALDSVTRENAPIALRLSRAVQEGNLRPRRGRINLAEIQRLTPDVRRAADSITRQESRLTAIDPNDLSFPFKELFEDLAASVHRAAGAARASATAFQLLPDMLGKVGPRNYLLMIQNNAEIRSTGGIPGSFAVLRADHGRVTMGLQGSAVDISGRAGPVPVPKEALEAYGSTIATDFRDITFNPDFPEVARSAAEMLLANRGIKVDGVVSVDPVALSFLLAATGPAKVPGGTVTSANVVYSLLNATYQVLPDQESQNSFFEKSARSVFDLVMSGTGNQQRLVTGLSQGVAEHRVMLWSARRSEQDQLSGSTVTGAITSPDDHRPRVGFYLNDATAGKMDFYLDYRTALSATRCRAGGVQDLDASIALTSHMPADFNRLSVWITGDGSFSPRGTIALDMRIYAPAGGRITALTVDGKPVSITADMQHGRQIGAVPLLLGPGQRTVVAARMRTAKAQSGSPVISFTPGIGSAPNGVSVDSACS